MSVDATEEFKPIPVRKGSGPLHSLLYGLRLIVDLQLLTCTRFLRPRLEPVEGTILDVGCGEMPFRSLMRPQVRYTGLDVPQATSFGMRDHKEIVAFDGTTIPFPDACFDTLLCTEVLEHAVDPVTLIAEMHRVLRPGGTLLVTVPFAARVHHAPYDFNRFTRFRLVAMFSAFDELEILERGNDIAVIANKLIVLCVRLAKPKKIRDLLWTGPLSVLLAPCAIVALLSAHLSLCIGAGSKNDPLGYGVVARKSPK
ncbi:methyltransferase domain-containing protein [Rhizobium lusitanum]|uniref:Methyltransferase domain-containing protein n=1 Tax=Rhizobium lusitanum TaxID=293958 RepID=A0A6L9U3G7_9HYPH|nr:class I SAM-dependent methyltransferase [Rhizobium lusitanum]NEI68816.1 methyltransferase domain-containing protein [Rhizobium lusitanum]